MQRPFIAIKLYKKALTIILLKAIKSNDVIVTQLSEMPVKYASGTTLTFLCLHTSGQL